MDHPHKWGNDPPRRFPGDKEDFMPAPSIPACRRQVLPPREGGFFKADKNLDIQID